MKGVTARHGRRALLGLVLMAAVAAFFTGCAGQDGSGKIAEPDYWPTDTWRSSTPEDQGMASGQLADMLAAVQARHLNLRSILVVRNGYLVTEAYFDPYGPQQAQMTASFSKSVVGALTGMAIEQGQLEGVQQKALPFFDEKKIANLDDAKRSITIGHLLSMTSCLDYDDLTGFRGEVMEQSQDWADFVLDLPVAGTPGSRFAYSSGSPHLVSAILQKATGQTTREYANQKLFAPLGIDPLAQAQWGSDPNGVTLGGYGLYLTPREMAKFGYLYLNRGRWEDRQLLSQEWVSDSTRRHITKDDGYGYGYLWTIDDELGSFAALGRGGQEVHVLPSQNLLVVFTAGLPSGKNQDLEQLKRLLQEFILPAVKSDQALPADSGGYARLQHELSQISRPEAPLGAVPDWALEISGKTFEFEQNQSGWKTMALTFDSGSAHAGVAIDGVPLESGIGLDNVYRVGRPQDGSSAVAMKGYWQGDRLVVHQLELGELDEYEFTIEREGEALRIEARNTVNGGEVSLKGVLRPGS